MTWSGETCENWVRSSSRTHLMHLARRERYLALETRGFRYNLGVKFGVVEAQIALAMAGVDRRADSRALARIDRSDRAERTALTTEFRLMCQLKSPSLATD